MDAADMQIDMVRIAELTALQTLRLYWIFTGVGYFLAFLLAIAIVYVTFYTAVKAANWVFAECCLPFEKTYIDYRKRKALKKQSRALKRQHREDVVVVEDGVVEDEEEPNLQ